MKRRLLILFAAQLCCTVLCGISMRISGAWFEQQRSGVNETRLAFHRAHVEIETAQSQLLSYMNAGDPQALTWFSEGLEALEKARAILAADGTHAGLSAYAALTGRYGEAGRAAAAEIPGLDQDAALARYESLHRIASSAAEFYYYLVPEVVDTIAERTVAINERAERQQELILGSALGVSVLLFAICLICLLRLFRPIQELTEYAGKIDFDHLEFEEVSDASDDEAGLLVTVFGDMVQRLKSEKEQAEEKRKVESMLQEERSRRAELESRMARMRLHILQSQINSHFLFNSLNIVAKLAFLENAPQSQEAAELIACFLRGVLKNPDRKTTVREEMKLAGQYLEIQKLRFGERITFTIETDPACEEMQILPMTVQPVVENALVHGVASYVGGGAVRCYAQKREGGLVLGVEDNGEGFTPEEREAVLRRCMEGMTGDAEGKGIGLANVFWRLRLEYGDRVRIRIESTPRERTAVELEIAEG